MSMLEDDLAFIMADEPFTTCATFTLRDGDTCTIDGELRLASDEALMFGNVPVEALKPSFITQTSKVPTSPTQLAVEIDGANYIVEKNERTGVGMTTLYLKTKQS